MKTLPRPGPSRLLISDRQFKQLSTGQSMKDGASLAKTFGNAVKGEFRVVEAGGLYLRSQMTKLSANAAELVSNLRDGTC